MGGARSRLGSVRTALYDAANIILTRPIKGGGPKSWAMRLAKRAGMMKAKVALARPHLVDPSFTMKAAAWYDAPAIHCPPQ